MLDNAYTRGQATHCRNERSGDRPLWEPLLEGEDPCWGETGPESDRPAIGHVSTDEEKTHGVSDYSER